MGKVSKLWILTSLLFSVHLYAINTHTPAEYIAPSTVTEKCAALVRSLRWELTKSTILKRKKISKSTLIAKEVPLEALLAKEPPILSLPEITQEILDDYLKQVDAPIQEALKMLPPHGPHAGSFFLPMFQRFLTGNAEKDADTLARWLSDYITLRTESYDLSKALGITVLEALDSIHVPRPQDKFIKTMIALEEAWDTLEVRGIDHFFAVDEENIPLIVIAPGQQSKLNKINLKLSEKAGFKSLLFRPFANYFHGVGASFNGTNVINLDAKTIVSSEISTEFQHELRHLVLKKQLKNRIENPYAGFIEAEDPGFPLPFMGYYKKLNSLDESFTHSRDVHYALRNFIKNSQVKFEAARVDWKLKIMRNERILGWIRTLKIQSQPPKKQFLFEWGGQKFQADLTFEKSKTKDNKDSPIFTAVLRVPQLKWRVEVPLVKSSGIDDPKNYSYFVDRILKLEEVYQKDTTFLREAMDLRKRIENTAVEDREKFVAEAKKLLFPLGNLGD